MNVVFEETKKSLLHGKDAVVCTIIKTEGSSPRKAGASMLVTEKGKTFGTIGGGALELECTRLAQEVYKTRKSYSKTFDLCNDEISMICGGIVEISFTFVEKNTDLDKVRRILNIQETAQRVYIFGAGHVGLELSKLLSHLDFDVILLDDRTGIDADYTVCDYANITKCTSIKKQDYVAIMTHGHIADREVLLQVCKINPSYIGCIGSSKKVEATKAFLRENKIEENIINSIHSPIGLPIGGDTPAEIAVSIAAQLIQIRNEQNQ